MKIEIRWTYGRAWIAACLAWFVLGFVGTGIEWSEAREGFLGVCMVVSLFSILISGPIILIEGYWFKPLKDSDDE